MQLRWSERTTIVVGQVAIGPITALHDLDLRLKAMDAEGWQSMLSQCRRWFTGRMLLSLRAARIVNDALAEAARAHPDRFVGLATLPQDPEAALTEVERAVTEQVPRYLSWHERSGKS